MTKPDNTGITDAPWLSISSEAIERTAQSYGVMSDPKSRDVSITLCALAADRDRLARELIIMTSDRDACIALFKPSERAAQLATDRNIELSRDLAAAKAELAQLREALEPLARAGSIGLSTKKTIKIRFTNLGARASKAIEVGHLRRAREVYGSWLSPKIEGR